MPARLPGPSCSRGDAGVRISARAALRASHSGGSCCSHCLTSYSHLPGTARTLSPLGAACLGCSSSSLGCWSSTSKHSCPERIWLMEKAGVRQGWESQGSACRPHCIRCGVCCQRALTPWCCSNDFIQLSTCLPHVSVSHALAPHSIQAV